jgi:hypothetical protein
VIQQQQFLHVIVLLQHQFGKRRCFEVVGGRGGLRFRRFRDQLRRSPDFHN